MQEVLGSNTKIIDSGNGKNLIYLPLDKLKSGLDAATAAAAAAVDGRCEENGQGGQPMKLLPPIIALLLVVLIANSAFIVPAGQSALVLQFGRIEGSANAAVDYKPGLHFKLPLVQQVVRYDRRILNLEAQPERYFTSEKKAVNVDFYVKWRISDPAAYYRSFGGGRNADAGQSAPRADHQGCAALRVHRAHAQRPDRERALGHHRKRAQAGQCGDRGQDLGIRVVDVRIKRIEFPDEVLASVYKRMSAERNRLANEQRSNGKEEAAKIEADADRQVQVIKAEAERDAQEARGEGDAKAAEIYAAAYAKDADFYAFYRSLQAYREAFRDGGVIVRRSEVRVHALFRRQQERGASSGRCRILFAAALCLVLVLEGLFLFAAPQAWQHMAEQMRRLDPRQLRLIGGIMVAVGLLVLKLVA